ncbi:squalene--hopene cyclase [Thermodesulforhabdus norvegica]|nr:squalene--hopene cyclase [Thermodesulforhabdus norvegica]
MMPVACLREGDFGTAMDRAISLALRWLEAQQKPEGYWMGWLESNSCMEAEWLLAFHFMGIRDPVKEEGLVKAILRAQRPDGSWQVYYNAPQGDINTTVECYAALRSVGFSPDHEVLKAARRWILSHGGLNSVRVFTQYWLALIGEWPWEATPTLPPELIFLPGWFPISIYEFASWARATIVPLAVLSARRPVRPLPPDRRLDELFPQGRSSIRPKLTRPQQFFSWDSLFYWGDRFLNKYTSFPFRPGRETAIRLCLEWIIRHQESDGAWGGIQPPWVYGLMALYNEGYSLDHPVMSRGLQALDAPHWSYWKDGALYVQASNSPVWDTVLSLLAMLDCGADARSSETLRKAVNWLLEQQVTSYGDWAVKAANVEPGGWAFEMANSFYPDLDDTAVAMMVLARVLPDWPGPAEPIIKALERAERWVRALQSSNGGWAAFDKDNTNRLVTRIPFCDFGEVLDPPSVDVTAHVVEALAAVGRNRRDPAVRKALRYIKSEQESDGSWFGRWGVNHIYGTSAVLQALRAIGEDMRQPYVRKAGEWLVVHQNEDGGWGETPASYMDAKLRGRGESTASQTAWALLGLLAIGDHAYRDSIRRGILYLIEHQRDDGTWDEPHYTGTGFPGYGHGGRTRLNGDADTLEQGLELCRGFMINYNMYRHYFPMMALARARKFLCGMG